MEIEAVPKAASAWLLLQAETPSDHQMSLLLPHAKAIYLYYKPLLHLLDGSELLLKRSVRGPGRS